mmetsp:Transcript_13333/g.19422  ORF Transcript_13333/g.19422 Transcript_13333/m.19422 type:complete len:80 (-) Transcript_13333:701-940(-)
MLEWTETAGTLELTASVESSSVSSLKLKKTVRRRVASVVSLIRTTRLNLRKRSSASAIANGCLSQRDVKLTVGGGVKIE